jgi:GNAT superfamily N-acetyltransferase
MTFIDRIVEESQMRFRDAWALLAEAGPRPYVDDREGVRFTLAGVPIALFNAAFPAAPLRSLKEVGAMAERVTQSFREQRVPGLLAVPASWIPRGGREVLAQAGFSTETGFVGMRTAQLAEPRYPLSVEPGEVSGVEASQILARLNGESYGMDSADWRHLELDTLWRPPVHAYAIWEENQPAACGAFAQLGDCCYLMWMATRPSSRGRGYAEAIIRKAWKDARERYSAKVTVLHATPMGRPVYLRLGYLAVAEFPGFVWEPGT